MAPNFVRYLSVKVTTRYVKLEKICKGSEQKTQDKKAVKSYEKAVKNA